MSDDWQTGRFYLAGLLQGGPIPVVGLLKGGLAIRMTSKSSPKGRRPAEWSITHVATGHRIGDIRANGSRVIEVANAVLALTDWEAFESVVGWKNTDPELIENAVALAAYTPELLLSGNAAPDKRLTEKNNAAQAVLRRLGR